jgi:hypothetical protein
MTVCLRRDLTRCVCYRPDASALSCCQGYCQRSACLTAALSERFSPKEPA